LYLDEIYLHCSSYLLNTTGIKYSNIVESLTTNLKHRKGKQEQQK